MIQHLGHSVGCGDQGKAKSSGFGNLGIGPPELRAFLDGQVQLLLRASNHPLYCDNAQERLSHLAGGYRLGDVGAHVERDGLGRRVHRRPAGGHDDRDVDIDMPNLAQELEPRQLRHH